MKTGRPIPVAASSARAIAAAAMVAGCAELPAAPTYLDDVRPLLLANCVRCHAAPTACTAPARRGFRLDHWSAVGEIEGVAAMTERIAVRAADAGTMPPDRGLAEREREILQRWQRAGSPRGERPGDAPPSLTVRSTVPTDEPADQRIGLDYDVRDPDGDTVLWSLGWQREGVDGVLAAQLPDGRGRVELDVGVLATGRYQLVAALDDDTGVAPVEVLVGGPITLPDRDAAPSVRLDYPRGGQRLSLTSVVEIRWTADDVDSAGPLTAAVELIGADGQVRELATGLDARAGRYAWKPGDTAAGAYRFEIRVSDGAAERRSRSSCDLALVATP